MKRFGGAFLLAASPAAASVAPQARRLRARIRAPSQMTVALLLVSALGLGLRLYAGYHRPIDHNGAWHVFIARNFGREYANLAHPPLFPLLLKGCDAISHSLIAFRFFPMLAGVGSIFLVGRILEKLGALPSVALLGALLMACARTAIVLSIIVESYSLCVLFLLGAFFYYLDLLPAKSRPPVRSRIAFSALGSLALLSHYIAGLFLVACVLAPLAALALRAGYRRAFRRTLRGRWKADLLTFLLPLAVGGTLYLLLAQPWVRPLNSFPSLYFRPGEETLSTFWIRNLRDTFNLFSPVAFGRARNALPLLAVFLAIVIWAPAAERREESESPRRLLPALFLALLLALGMVLGVLGRYPFGGLDRHQVLLLVFGLLSGFVALDCLLRSLTREGQVVFALLTLLLMAASFARNVPGVTVPAYDTEALVARRGIFRMSLAENAVVHLDHFNLIGLMMDFYEWDWRFDGPSAANASIERYELSGAGRRLRVIAHRKKWILDFQSPDLYAELRSSGGWGNACEVVFCVNRNLYGRPWSRRPEEKRNELQALIPGLAETAGLNPRRLVVGDDAIFFEFCRGDSPEPARSRVSTLIGAPSAGRSAR